MIALMPSPIGHALAGIAVALAGGRQPASRHRHWLSSPVTRWCIAIAVLPDADLLVRGFHRSATHSIGATLLVMIVAMVVTRWVTGSAIAWRVVLVLGAAHASHIVLDWLGADWFSPPGIQALWPFSDGWFISGWDLFPRIERRNPFSSATMMSNLLAAAREIAIVGPVAAAMWWVRKRVHA